MKISDIYEKYKIMPNLQEHMLRVAGVASVIVESFDKTLDKNSIISACLLHDMGNIIKFDIGKFPEALKPNEYDYWKKVKKDYLQKFGNDEHIATYKILEEIGLDKRIKEIVKGFGFSKAEQTFKLDDLEVKTSAYSDHRVSPYGILSLYKKLADTRKRYAKMIKAKRLKDFEKLASFWQNIEKQIFAHCKIEPEDITEEKVKPLLNDLSRFEIDTDVS